MKTIAMQNAEKVIAGMAPFAKSDALYSLSHNANPQEMVEVFHNLYGMPNQCGLDEAPCQLSVSRRDLRLKLILEEFLETVEASGFKLAMVNDGINRDLQLRHIEGSQQDIVEMADGLADIVCVCFGMAVEMGIDLMEVLREVHAANLTKLGADGKPIINHEVECDECDGRGYLNRDPDNYDKCGKCGGKRRFSIDPTLPIGKVIKGPNYVKADIASVIGVKKEN